MRAIRRGSADAGFSLVELLFVIALIAILTLIGLPWMIGSLNRAKLVGAANNARVLSYPTTFSSVFSVAAHAEPEPWRWYYNPRPPVEFGAWGVDVPVAWKDGSTIVATGNSFAAPHIAGLLARLCAKHPGLSPFEAKAILAATADDPLAGNVSG